MAKVFQALVGFLLLTASSTAFAQHGKDWNEEAFAAIYNNKIENFPESAEILASLNVAMFEATNSIERKYKNRFYLAPVRLGANKDAAIAAAAYTILTHYIPSQSARFYNLRKKWIKEPLKQDVADGLEIGESVAREIIRLRSNSQLHAIQAWETHVKPGTYIPTSPPVSPLHGNSKTWVLPLQVINNFSPPPALESKTFIDSLDETNRLGANDSKMRTAEQTKSAIFFQASGVHVWNRVLYQLSSSGDISEIDFLRTSAQLNVALADSFIAAWHIKYKYNFWRPITAIHNSDHAPSIDSSWLPLVNTPLHPEFPSGHSSNAGAAVEVLAAAFKTKLTSERVKLTSEYTPGITRTYDSLSQLVQDIEDARVWAGVHFRFSCVAGRELGSIVGRQVVSSLYPVQEEREHD